MVDGMMGWDMIVAIVTVVTADRSRLGAAANAHREHLNRKNYLNKGRELGLLWHCLRQNSKRTLLATICCNLAVQCAQSVHQRPLRLVRNRGRLSMTICFPEITCKA